MKFCSKCGNELLDEAVICPKCGCSTENRTTNNTNKSNSKIQTAFVLNIIAVVLSLVSVIMLSLFITNNSTPTSAKEKKFSEMIEIKKEYEASIKEEEIFYEGKGKTIQEKEEYKKVKQNIENCIIKYGMEKDAEELTNRVAPQNEEEATIIEGCKITLRRAKAEKAYNEIKDSYKSACSNLFIFGALFLLVLISFLISIVVKVKMGKDSKKKTCAWIYLFFVIVTDIVYTMFSFIILIYVICGIGFLIPVPPILQTIAAVKFIQATKE